MIGTKHEEMERSRKLCGWEPPDQEPGGWNHLAFSTNSVVSEWPTFFGLDTGHFSSSAVPFITCARGSLSAGGCVFFSQCSIYLVWFPSQVSFPCDFGLGRWAQGWYLSTSQPIFGAGALPPLCCSSSDLPEAGCQHLSGWPQARAWAMAGPKQWDWTMKLRLELACEVSV